jgi:hypothetical protein
MNQPRNPEGGSGGDCLMLESSVSLLLKPEA